MELQHQIDHLQARSASKWFELLKHGRAEDRAAFADWCRQSPLHIQEFLEITCTERALDAVDLKQTGDDVESLLGAISNSTRALPLRPDLVESKHPAESPRKTQSRWAWTIAASLALFTAAAVVYQYFWYPNSGLGSQEYSTKVGELRTVELVDKSVITLNTDSDVRIRFEDDARDIELRHGEAVFKVAHDPSRPFRVHTRAGTVQAVGTQFNVYDRVDGRGTDVAVLEGRVRLIASAPDGLRPPDVEVLTAGEEARITPDGSIRRAARADVQRATAWSQRRLKFDNAPLENMVDEFNRYHRDVRLRVDGVPPGSHHYSGIFDADKPEMFAKYLEQERDLIIERLPGEIVIRPRESGSSGQ